MPAVAIDYDGTLVDEHGVINSGALTALKAFRRMGLTIIVYSSRASHPEGREKIAQTLERRGFPESEKLRIEPKPEALIYIDDRGHRFAGWSDAIRATVRAHEDHKRRRR